MPLSEELCSKSQDIMKQMAEKELDRLWQDQQRLHAEIDLQQEKRSRAQEEDPSSVPGH